MRRAVLARGMLIIFSISVLLLLAFSMQAEDSLPTVTTTPKIGQPSINKSDYFYDFQWCDTDPFPRKTKFKVEISSIKAPSTKVSIKDWLKHVTIAFSGPYDRKSVPSIFIDYNHSEISKVSAFVYNESHWKNHVSSNSIRRASSWQHIDKHIGISIGVPSKSVKMPSQVFGMVIFTNADSWKYLPVGDNDGDGKASSIRLKLTGKPGLRDTFGILLPKALLKKWGLNKSNLAGFVNGKKVKITIQTAAKGLIVSFKITYPVKSVAVGKKKL